MCVAWTTVGVPETFLLDLICSSQSRTEITSLRCSGVRTAPQLMAEHAERETV